MEVVKDQDYERCIKSACDFYNRDTPDARCVKYAEATWRIRRRYEEYRSRRQNKCIKVISKKKM
jgi:hypothetical protein